MYVKVSASVDPTNPLATKNDDGLSGAETAGIVIRAAVGMGAVAGLVGFKFGSISNGDNDTKEPLL